MKNMEIGKIGENIACQYLLNKHYLILTRNHKERFDEIDIIARHRDGALVFCEVKTINYNETFSSGLMPEDNLNQVKYRKMIRASAVFLARHPGLVRESRGWQIDLVAIFLKEEKYFGMRHYENI